MILQIFPKKISAGLVIAAAVALCAALHFSAVRSTAAPSAQAAAAQSGLEYDYFKANVEPIFLKHRPGHARCYTCHVVDRHPGTFHLEIIAPGATFWSEEQSRANFQLISSLVIPGAPKSSFLLLKPLAPEAGGNNYRLHDGGRQFETQDDPDWKILATWVSGEKAK